MSCSRLEQMSCEEWAPIMCTITLLIGAHCMPTALAVHWELFAGRLLARIGIAASADA